MEPGKCWCRNGGPVAFTDSITQIGYCYPCAMSEKLSSLNVHLQYIATLLPLEVGNRVECRTEGEHYDGDGMIILISDEVKHGGTPVHPAFLVHLDDGRDWWYTEVCLTVINDERPN